MHSFTELIDRCAAFTLSSLEEVNSRTIESLQTSGATSLVKTLQMITLQKTVLAVGMFSIFEATLQDGLKCEDGFKAAKEILDSENEVALKESFNNLFLAVNVLKHGRGRSYDSLVKKAADLHFRVRLPDEDFFEEGDVSEISTLVQVDDTFVQYCADTIRQVSEIVQRDRPIPE